MDMAQQEHWAGRINELFDEITNSKLSREDETLLMQWVKDVAVDWLAAPHFVVTPASSKEPLA